MKGPDNQAQTVDFSEYEWMGDEDSEAVDRQLEEELFEEEFIESLFEYILDEREKEEELERLVESLVCQYTELSCIDESDILSRSNLNPNAPVFVPGMVVQAVWH